MKQRSNIMTNFADNTEKKPGSFVRISALKKLIGVQAHKQVTSKIDYATTGKLSTLKHRKIDYATTGKLAM